MSMDESDVLRAAERAYFTEPLLHAQVETVERIMVVDVARLGREMTDDERSIAMRAAAVALVVQREGIAEGRRG